MAFETLENAMVHTKQSRNVRTARADGRGSREKAQRNESARMSILHNARIFIESVSRSVVSDSVTP